MPPAGGITGHPRTAVGSTARHRPQGPRQNYRKTKMCKFHASGVCMHQENCEFAHGAHELRVLPDLHHSRPCLDFVNTGRCSWGGACSFAHADGGAAPSSARAEVEGRGAAAQGSCSDFSSSHCPGGAAHYYAHGPDEQGPPDGAAAAKTRARAGAGQAAQGRCSDILNSGYSPGSCCRSFGGRAAPAKAGQGSRPDCIQSSLSPGSGACSDAHGPSEPRHPDGITREAELHAGAGAGQAAHADCADSSRTRYCPRGSAGFFVSSRGELHHQDCSTARAAPRTEAGSGRAAHADRSDSHCAGYCPGGGAGAHASSPGELHHQDFVNTSYCLRGGTSPYARRPDELCPIDRSAAQAPQGHRADFTSTGYCCPRGGGACSYAHSADGRCQPEGGAARAKMHVDLGELGEGQAPQDNRADVINNRSYANSSDELHRQDGNTARAELPAEAGAGQAAHANCSNSNRTDYCPWGGARSHANSPDELHHQDDREDFISTGYCLPRGGACSYAHSADERCHPAGGAARAKIYVDLAEGQASQGSCPGWGTTRNEAPQGNRPDSGSTDGRPGWGTGSEPHGADELHHPDGSAARTRLRAEAGAGQPPQASCLDFVSSGYCPQGSTCSYARGPHELRRPDGGAAQAKVHTETGAGQGCHSDSANAGFCPWGGTGLRTCSPDERHPSGNTVWTRIRAEMEAGRAAGGSQESPEDDASRAAQLEELALEVRQAMTYMKGLEVYLLKAFDELEARRGAAEAAHAPAPQGNVVPSGRGAGEPKRTCPTSVKYRAGSEDRAGTEEGTGDAEGLKAAPPWVAWAPHGGDISRQSTDDISRQSTDDAGSSLMAFACLRHGSALESWDPYLPEQPLCEGRAGREQRLQVSKAEKGVQCSGGPKWSEQKPVAWAAVRAYASSAGASMTAGPCAVTKEDAHLLSGRKQQEVVRVIAGLCTIKKNTFLEVLGSDQSEDPRSIYSDGEA